MAAYEAAVEGGAPETKDGASDAETPTLDRAKLERLQALVGGARSTIGYMSAVVHCVVAEVPADNQEGGNASDSEAH